jgi:hypothetical protein
MNIIKNRYLYFLISLLVIVPGIAFMIYPKTNLGASVKNGPLPLGCNFLGLALLQVKLKVFSFKLRRIRFHLFNNWARILM